MAKNKNYTKSIRAVLVSFTGLVVRLAILAVCVLVIFRAGKYAFDFGFRIFTEEAMSPVPGRDVAVTIVQGDSLMDTCKMLEEKGLVRDAKLAWIQKKVSVYDNDIEPGFYTLNTSMTADEMYAIIAGSSTEEENDSQELDENSSKATPLTEGEVDLDSIIDSTIPDGDVVNDPYDEGGAEDGGEGEDAQGDASEGNTENAE